MTHVIGVGLSARKRANDLSDFGAELDMIEALGVETIELPTYDMDIVVGGRIRRPQLEAMKRAIAGRDVTFTVHGPLAINFLDQPFRLQRHFDVLKASLEVAAEAKAENYVMHSGLMPVIQADGIAEGYARQRDMLAKAGDIAKDLGIMLCVENLFGGYEGRIHSASPARLAAELDAIGHSHVRATLDFSHGYINCSFHGLDYLAEIAALAPHAKHLHIHDSFGRQDDTWMFTNGERLAYGHGDLHLPVGWGDIPWEDAMRRCRFPDGVVFNIELQERYWYVAQDTVDATKRLAQAA
jgi:sugar phosphate isomerase/epimerase